jgi:gliding motility-associated-like protein
MIIPLLKELSVIKINMTRLLLITILNLFLLANSHATHLVGGNLAYEFVGIQPNGDFRYTLKLNYYFDCGSNSNWQPPSIPTNMSVAVYAHDDPTDIYPTTSGSYPKYGSSDVDMVYSSTVQQYFEVTPNNPSGCTVGTSTCVYTVLYTGQVDLSPINPTTGAPVIGGYFLIHEACCRNGGGNGIDNIQSPGSAAMAFYSYIPPYGYENNSPIFTDNPVPFICSGDTTTFLNTAIDPDGDELIFSFMAPLDGNHAGGFGGGANNVGNGGAGPGGSLNWYPNNYPWPIEEVTYAGGYSYQQPFGPTGYYYISASNGLTKYKSNNQGKYVVGLFIKEYRNGTLIGISTREVQLNIIACPPNDAPSLSPNINPQGGTDSTEYFIEEGENLCFDISFFDPDTPADSLTLNVSGQIFDSNFTNPPATVGGYFDTLYSDPINGIDTVGTTFCWNTTCGQAQNLPYVMSASVSDRGCPPKTTSVVYEVTVSKTDPPANIYGSLIECQNTETVYTTDNNPNISGYTWDVSNNGIITQDYGDSVKIFWNAPGTGTIFLKAINQYGCESDPISINTTVTPGPTVDAGSDVNICLGDSVLLTGTTNSLPGYISLWQPSTNVTNPSSMSSWVSPTSTTSYYLLVQRGTSCVGGDSITVTVDVGNIDAGNDTTICFGDSVQLNAAGNGSNYSWTPTTNISQTNIQNPIVWPDITTKYYVQFSSANNCQAEDSVIVFVNPSPGSNPNFILNGSANSLGNNTYQMTTAINNDFASIWNSSMLNLNQAFQLKAEMNFGTLDATGADGMAFVLQQTSTAYAPTLGNADFAIIDPSLIVEFDTWNNQNYNDINDDHIAILTDGSSDHNVNSLVSPISLGNVEDGAWHTVTFNWDPLAQNFSVNFDGVQLINLNYDIVQNIFNNNATVYWGFTATTGGSNNNQSIRFTNNSTNTPILDLVICKEDTILVNPPVVTDNYSWTPNLFINDNTLETPLFSPDITTTYFFTGTTNFGCFVKDTFQITVNNLPVVNAGSDIDICIGDSISLNASGNAASFSWDNNIIDGQIFEVNNTLNYILTGTSLDGCLNTDTVNINALTAALTNAGSDINLCINDSVQIQASGADNYSWSPNIFLSADNVPNPWATPTSQIIYILTGIMNNGCIKTDTLMIDVNPLPTLSTSNDTTVCEGDTIQIDVFGGNLYSWLNTSNISNLNISNPLIWPTSTTTYKVLASDINTCADTAEITINVNQKPIVNAGLDQDICFGDSTSLNASGSSVSYFWNNGILDGILFEAITTQDYIVEGTDLNNCTNKDTVTVNILTLPTIDAGQDETICIGDSIQLSASGGITYQWSPSTNISNVNVSNPTVSPTNLTTYIVTGIDTNNCANNDTLNISINELPTITTSNDTAICYGDSISISASGGAFYQWLNSDSIDNINLSSPQIWPSNTSIYSVVVTGLNSCIDTSEVNIQVNSLPELNAGLDQSICIGDTAQINVSGAVNFQWSPNINISSTISNSIEAWPLDTVSYMVTGIDANFCFGYDTVRVNVWDLPSADAGTDLWICPGGSANLNASGGIQFLWGPDSTLSVNNIFNPSANPIDDETYVVEVTDVNNCVNYDTVFLKVNPNVPTDAGEDTLIICGSTSVILGGNPTSPFGSSFLWSSSSSLIGPNTSNPTAQPLTPSWFVVETTNDTCTGTDSVYVDFFGDVIGNSSNDTSICYGESILLTASGGNSYSWLPLTNLLGDTILNDDSLSSPTAFPLETTTFTVSIFDTNGCSIIDSTTINIKLLPVFDLGQDLSYCLNDSIELTSPTNQNYIYSWSPNYFISNNNSYNPTVFSQIDTTYTLALTDTLNCTNYDSIGVNINSLPTVFINAASSVCSGDSTLLSASGSSLVTNYSWSPSSFLSVDYLSNTMASPISSIYYYVIATDSNNCSNIDSIFLNVLDLPIADAGNDTAICPGQTLQLNGSGGSTPEWDNATSLSNTNIYNPLASPISITNYILKVTDTFGCINYDSILVDIFNSAVASAGADIDTCANIPVQLLATGGVSYLWNDSIYLNRRNVANPLAFPNDDLEFIVQVTDSNGCIDSDTINVFIFLANTSNDTIICKDDSFQANIYGDLPTTITWSPVDGVSDPFIGNPVLSPFQTTTYLVNLNDNGGCTIVDTLVVDVPEIEATFDTLINAGCDGIEITYNNTSELELDFYWIFNDADSSTNNEIVKTFGFGSDYSGSLFVQDSNGCLESLTYSGEALTFDDYFTIIEPNVFTPNGDGDNDEFIIVIPEKVEECAELTIYNRWGQVQYFSTGNDLKWDGRNNVGSEAPAGTYLYTLSIKDKKFPGSLYLIR